MRRLWWLLGTLTAASLLGVAAPAIPASANVSFYQELAGSGLYVTNGGPNVPVYLGLLNGASHYTEVPQQPTGWFLEKDQFGDCLNQTNTNIVSSSCHNGDTLEEWSKAGTCGCFLENRHYGVPNGYQTAGDFQGAFVYRSTGSQWSFVGP